MPKLIDWPCQDTHLHAVIFLVAYVDESEGVSGDAPGIIESAVGSALRAESSQKAAGRIEHLDPVVVAVRDDILPDPVYGHSGEAIELTLAATVRSELLHEVPITVEYLRTERCTVVYNKGPSPFIKIGSRPTITKTMTRNFPRVPYLRLSILRADVRKILRALYFSFTRSY